MLSLASLAAAFAPSGSYSHAEVGLPQCQTFLGTEFNALRLAFLPGAFDAAQCCEKCGELTIPGANCGSYTVNTSGCYLMLGSGGNHTSAQGSTSGVIIRPQPKSMFSISGPDIEAAAANTTAAHSVENLVIGKILGLFNTQNVLVTEGVTAFSSAYPTLAINGGCSNHVELSAGWTTTSTVQTGTGAVVSFAADKAQLLIQSNITLSTVFSQNANAHQAKGSTVIHPRHKKCGILSTHNSAQAMSGLMDLAANVTLHLQPSLTGNLSSGYRLHLTPKVGCVGVVTKFQATNFAGGAFGVPWANVAAFVGNAVRGDLAAQATAKAAQPELAQLLALLQGLVTRVWSPEYAYATLSNLTQADMDNLLPALKNINTTQAAQYP